VHETRKRGASALCPSSGIVNAGKRDVSGTESGQLFITDPTEYVLTASPEDGSRSSFRNVVLL
jgi:hypothetical protein